MPFAMIVAWLEREKNYHKDDIRNLTRRYVNGILNWPVRKDGTLQRPPASDTDPEPLSDEERLAQQLFMRGLPTHRIGPKVREMMAARRQQQQGE